MNNHICESKLPKDTSLCVYADENLIFSCKGKWLMPLFELETFLTTYTGSRDCLSAHDSAVGKAAAVLMIRLGIKRIHADLASDCAKNYIDELNNSVRTDPLIFTWYKKVSRLFCATETQLSEMTDVTEMYSALRIRAGYTNEQR